MRYEMMDVVSVLWSPKTLEKLKTKGCGMINCRSKLSSSKSVRDEIQQRIDHGFHDGITVAPCSVSNENEPET